MRVSFAMPRLKTGPSTHITPFHAHIWHQYSKQYSTHSALNPLTWRILICFTIVLFPDSPAPRKAKTAAWIHAKSVRYFRYHGVCSSYAQSDMPDWAVKHGAFENTASYGSRMSDITPQDSAYPTTTVDVWLYKPVSLFATVSLFSCWPLAVLSRRCAGLRFYCSPNTPSYSLEANLRAALMNDQSNSDSKERKLSTIDRRKLKKKVAGKGFVSPPCYNVSSSPGVIQATGLMKLITYRSVRWDMNLHLDPGVSVSPYQALFCSLALSVFFYVIFSACISAVVCNSALPLSVTPGNGG